MYIATFATSKIVQLITIIVVHDANQLIIAIHAKRNTYKYINIHQSSSQHTKCSSQKSSQPHQEPHLSQQPTSVEHNLRERNTIMIPVSRQIPQKKIPMLYSTIKQIRRSHPAPLKLYQLYPELQAPQQQPRSRP